MKSMVRHILDHGIRYDALAFSCPGCALKYGDGLHMLPVNTIEHSPSWDWDGNLEAPTVSPSILTKSTYKGVPFVCHSYLKAGVFEFLSDCTHPLVNQHVAIPDLPNWVTQEEENSMDEETVTETTTVTETHEVDDAQAAKDAAGISGGSDTSAEARAAREAEPAPVQTDDEASGISGELGKDLSGVADAANAQTLANASPASTGAMAPPGSRFADSSSVATSDDGATSATPTDDSTVASTDDASTAATPTDDGTAAPADGQAAS